MEEVGAGVQGGVGTHTCSCTSRAENGRASLLAGAAADARLLLLVLRRAVPGA